LLAACGDNVTEVPDRADWTGEAATIPCLPNLDGEIYEPELPTALGIPIHYRVSPDGAEREVNLSGVVEDGTRVWDWGTDDASDARLTVQAAPLAGHWYDSSFPGGQFVLPVDAGGSLEGVYERDVSGLYLLGLASAAESPAEGQTLVVYTQRIATLEFPIRPGESWQSSSTITGATIRGLPYAGYDTYDVEVDAFGRLRLPDLTFTQVHRVRTSLTEIPVVGFPRTVKQVSFVAECFGEVARATSRDGELTENFTTAAEVRRLGL
jgi:hypothetical protein